MIKDKQAVGVIKALNKEYGVDILSKDSDRKTSDVRRMYCAFIYGNTRLTLQNLAEILSKSVSNIAYYLRSHDKQMKLGEAYADHFAEFQDRIEIESAKI